MVNRKEKIITKNVLLSVIIPVLNEENTIGLVIDKVQNADVLGLRREIIVVDDASHDSSKLIANSLKQKSKNCEIKVISHKENQGKGAAVITGINNSKGDIIIIQDADLEYDPVYYPKLLKPIINRESDVVYGTRLKNYPLRIFGKRKTPLITHYLGNKLLSFITNILYGRGLSDMETGYKVFNKEVISDLKLKSKRFELEPELTAKILKKGYRIHEVPIKIQPRGYNEGKKATWKDGFIALWTLVKYRFVD